tara:strand:+ start:7826 stop:8320 length:495 start_codon:yes stop_codon:yes gene_type:complete
MIYKATEDETLLDKLVKDDARWRMVALKLCGSKEMADDLVQDMYLKVAEYESINASFVYKALKSLYIDNLRERKNARIEEHNYLECKDKSFEPNDYEQDILNKFDELYWTDQDLIRESYDRSMRQIQKMYPMINYSYAQRQILKSIKEILGKDFEDKYNNTRKK